MAEVQNRIHDKVSEASAVSLVAKAPPRERDVARLATGTGIALGGKVAGRGVRLLVDIALARLLGPFHFGLYAIGWTLARMISLISPLGLNVGVIRFGSQYWRRADGLLKGALLQSLWLALFSGSFLGVGFYLAAPWVGEAIFHNPEETSILRCFALALPLITALTVAAAATRVSQHMKFSAYAEDICQPAANLALFFLLSFMWGFGLVNALAACVFSFGLALMLALSYIRNVFPEVISPQIKPAFPGKELLIFSLPASFTGVTGVLLTWTNRLLVGYFRPAAEVGIYHAASQLSVALAIILAGFCAVFSPMAADLYHRGEVGRLEELFRVSTKWALYLSMPLFLVMCFASRQVMTVLFGTPYAAGGAALLILVLGQLVNAGTGPVGVLLLMTGHQNAMSIVSGLSFLGSVGLGLIFVPRWGMEGAAIATSCALGGLFISAIFIAGYTLRMRPYDWRYLKGLVATVIAVGALFLLRTLGITSPVFGLLSTTVVCTVAFGLALIFSGLEAEDRELVRLVHARLK